MLRVLLGINSLALLAALAQSPDLAGWLGRYVELAAVVEPWLLLSLGVLARCRGMPCGAFRCAPDRRWFCCWPAGWHLASMPTGSRWP
jgi:hypothetical protein